VRGVEEPDKCSEVVILRWCNWAEKANFEKIGNPLRKRHENQGKSPVFSCLSLSDGKTKAKTVLSIILRGKNCL
jgi:hypothetical protein